MSVISNQCDELRDRAGTLRTSAESIGDEAVRNTMVIAAEEMFKAADTIWELRCKMEDMVDQRNEIERLRAENSKLRDDWESERDYADQMEAKEKRAVAENNMLREMLSESRQANEHIFTELKRYKSVMRTRPIAMNALFDENTKLRELAKNLHACNGSCPRCVELMGKCEYEEQLAECGIEVDG